ncbi:spliceosome-associated protein CWC27 homolog [Actinia tenebrosa]|uniref:Spliceosome-associated protein CWC27 homolog n=1 Tax=Actinia tenebrosa TaxID=6105 RepID=A0A6P8IQB5_ACTTE|nr:spliceosome-associated protein CWC27 homolog [Actinia tenebrosa]
MSNIYIQEPPTNGKVLLETSVGDIDIELWSKEAPMACRNFIQLCLEHYYDDTIFHRIVKGFCIQGGDPTGTGFGGESVYGKRFKDEFHQRLKFNRRGLVAMANSGPNDNGSQFFFTLDRTDDLNGKHTIFGKITGNTIYNMLKMVDLEVDDNDHPLYPPKIKRTEVLSNPFDDIEPRNNKMKKDEALAPKKPKAKGTKNFSLLSFGEEAEEDEEEVINVGKELKMKSSHDVLDDPTLSKQTVNQDASKEKDGDKNLGEQARQKLKKQTQEYDDDSSEDEPTESTSKSKELRKESTKLLKEIKESRRKAANKETEPESKTVASKDKLSRVVADFRAERDEYVAKVKGTIKAKGDGRSEQTFSLLADFQAKLNEKIDEENSDEENSDKDEGDEKSDDIGWMTHVLHCEEGMKQKVKDANIQDEDTYEIFDPRNPINKRRREASKEAMKGKRRKER